MQCLKILLILAVCLAVGTTWAQCDDGQDEVCLFWSTDCAACQNCAVSVGAPITVYVVLINASQTSGVRGFEFRLVNSDGSVFPPANVEVLGYQFPPTAINVALPPNFVVGMAEAIPWSPCITLMSVELRALDDTPWCFGLMPPTPSSLPNSMGYVADNAPGFVLPLYPCTGDDGFSIACLNDPGCPPPVVESKAAWGKIKGLFR